MTNAVHSRYVRSNKLSMPSDYVVQKIIGKRVKNGNDIEYKVKWKGYDSSQNTWEPLRHLKNVSAMVKDFEKRNQQKLNQFSSTFREPSEKMAKQLPKKSLSKKSSKKVQNLKMNKDEQKKAQRQSLRVSQKSQDKSRPPNSKSSNRKVDSHSDVLAITTLNQEFGQNQSQQPDFEINLDSVVEKITKAVNQKQQVTYKITGLVKAKPGKPDGFLVQDSHGKQSHQSRQYVLKNLPLELIAFYQGCIELSSSRNDGLVV